MTRTKVAILYGGRSVEHGVSINSARNIFEYIDRDRFDPLLFGISGKGSWHLCASVTKEIEDGEPLSLIMDASRAVWKTLQGSEIAVDIAFPVLHGTDGEDGSVQGLLKTMDIPMVGTTVLGSSISMSKLVSKQLLQKAGLPVAGYLACAFAERDALEFEDVKKRIGVPFMVKAASLGSSVGVSKVKSASGFRAAVDEAFRYDDHILLEEYIKGREIECAVLGNDPPLASLPGEIVISSNYEFYTFDAKYVDKDAVRIDVPAKLDSLVSERIRDLSIQAYKVLCCEDFARVDLFLRGNEVFVNEINTIPGFTNSSMYPMMWKERGLSFGELISKLIQVATERYRRSKRVERDYQSALKF